MQPLCGDPDNPPEEANAITQSRTPLPFFNYWRLLSGSCLPASPIRRRHRIEPRIELLHLEKTHPSRDGRPAMPRQFLHIRFKQVIFLQRLPPLTTDPPMESIPQIIRHVDPHL